MELTGEADPDDFSTSCVKLTGKKGHSGEVFATRFDATGELIASGSMDRSISMFSAYNMS